MKAYVLYDIGNLRYTDVEQPHCKDDWAIVKVKASGICSSDIGRIYRKGTYHFPTIPGHEFAGIVESVGNKSYEAMIGKRVSVFPLIPCKKCSQCLSGHYEMCSNYDYLGSRRDGGFAERVAVPLWNLIEVPETISFEEAAMMEPLSVALHAIKRGGIEHGDSVAINGTGMIGFAAAQLASLCEASTIAVVGRNENKREYVENTLGLRYENVTSCKDQFDLVVEAVGSNESITHAINLVRPGGRLVLMGNPEGKVSLPQNDYWQILRKQLNIVGTWNSTYENNSSCDWEEVRQVLVDQKMNAKLFISHRYHQSELKKGLELMRTHEKPYCKIMTIWNED